MVSRCPAIRPIASLTRWRSAMNGVAGPPSPRLTAATRSLGDNRSMKALAAASTAPAPPGRMCGSSITNAISRPPVAFSFELYPSGTRATGFGLAGSDASGTHSALTTVRGLPSTRTVKSAGIRPSSGLP